ncbi:MAG: hypothetical protein AAGF31_00560 [Planctomycetota bacterium]
MLVIGVLALFALVTLVAAYLGSKHWHWAHVTVVVALFFTTFGFAFLAAEVLAVRGKFQKRAEDAAERLEPLQETNALVVRGTGKPAEINRLIAQEIAIDEEAAEEPAFRAPGLVDLRHQLRLTNRRIGRVWRNAQPIGPPNQQTGEVTVEIEFPQPLGISEGAILFVFEQGPANIQDPSQGRQYLGEFRVATAGEQQLTLEPVLTLDDYEYNRLLDSRGPWALYETMPVDRHDMFERFTDDQLRQIIPEASVEEYLRDGTPWTVDDGEWTKEGRDENDQVVGPEDWDDSTRFVYRRQLRDYAYLFNEFAKSRIELEARREALEEDIEKLKATLARAEEVGRYRKAEQTKLKADLARVVIDRKAIEAHLAALEKQLARGRQLRDRLIASNSQLADQLAAKQQALLGSLDLEQQPAPARGAVDIDAL